MRTFLTLLLVAVIGCASASAPAPTKDPATAPTTPAQKGGFALDLETWDGGRFSFEEIRGRKHLLVAFWATWCDPCKAELRELAALYPRFRDKVEFVAVSTDGEGEMDKVRAFAAEQGLPFPVLVDPARKKISAFIPGGDTVPYSMLVNSDGVVISAHTGYEPGDEQRIIQELEALPSP